MLNQPTLKRQLLFAAFLAIIFFWISLFLSYSPNPENAEFVATGGFPLTCCNYPYSPMGEGIPANSLSTLALNLFFWLFIGGLVDLLAPDDWRTNLVLYCVSVAAVLSTFVGVFYLLLKFD